MMALLEILDNALLQGLTYGVAVTGIAIALRIVRYPDLTADGSFLIGAATFCALLPLHWHWGWAYMAAALTGAAAGGLTSLLHFALRINRLITGILTTMIIYSASFRILGGKSNVGLANQVTMFSGAERLDSLYAPRNTFIHPVSVVLTGLIALSVVAIVSVMLRSDLGLLLRAVGGNPRLVKSLGWSVSRLTVLSLLVANALIAFSGSLIASRQGFADINMGGGVVIILIAALIVGEEFGKYIGINPARSVSRRTIAAFIGAVIYFFLYLLVLRASLSGILPITVQPTDLRMVSAVVLVGAIAMRAFRGKEDEEVFPI